VNKSRVLAKIIKDPIHGYIKIYNHELKIVDSRPFQRLRRIRQLSLADYVYPGATHSRFIHSLGVAHVAEILTENIVSKLNIDESEKERYIAMMRLAAMLHDIGHGPFSHIFEDYILYPRRITHERIGAEIIRSNPELQEAFESIEKELNVSANLIAKMLESTAPENWPLQNSLDTASERALFYVLKGAYSADIIDYLLRDSYFTGAGYGSNLDWVRLAHFTSIEGDVLVLDYRAREVLDQVLIARVYMFTTVYYHKKVRAIQKVAGDLLMKIGEAGILNYDEYINDPELYLELDDEFILSHPEIRKLEEARNLLARKIPYKMVIELPISLPEQIQKMMAIVIMSRRTLQDAIANLLPNNLKQVLRPEKEFFVDTPNLPFNPMISGEEVHIKEASGAITKRRVTDLTWLSSPHTIALIRLYIHSKYLQYSSILREIFEEIASGGLRSFY